LVVSNSTQGVGGGACYCYYLYNCTIANNRSAGNGGGVRDGKYANCIVYGNIPNNWYDTNSFFTNSCTYPTQSTWQVADRNITNDPFFVSTNTGNYHLRQDSACINAGANAYVRTNMPADLDGRSRIDHYSRIVDMGCYEYLPSGSMYSFGF
jgi:hypothetical protein